MIKRIAKSSILLILALFLTQCRISLSGVSIDPNASTYYIANIDNNAFNTPANLEGQFKDALDLKIRQNTRLKYNDETPDVSFKGSIVGYEVTSEGTRDDRSVELNRLKIKVYIEYTPLDEKKAWEKNFNYFYDFDANVELSTIEDDAIKEIFDQIIEDIFNTAFGDW